MSGVNSLFGLVKIFRNGAKFASLAIFGEAAAAVVVGRFLSRFDSPTSASVSVARYLISSQASSGCLEPFGTATMSPPTEPEPYWPGCESADGNGAVVYLSSGCSALMNALRHSPSYCIATRPISKSFEAPNSSAEAAVNLRRLS